MNPHCVVQEWHHNIRCCCFGNTPGFHIRSEHIVNPPQVPKRKSPKVYHIRIGYLTLRRSTRDTRRGRELFRIGLPLSGQRQVSHRMRSYPTGRIRPLRSCIVAADNVWRRCVAPSGAARTAALPHSMVPATEALASPSL